jgi:hypothetical protein
VEKRPSALENEFYVSVSAFNYRFHSVVQQPKLRGILYVAREQALQIVFAIKIPGDITPP